MDDLIDYFKLETQVYADYTRHLVHIPDAQTGRDREVEERWHRKKLLGKGSFGSVWLEQIVGSTYKTRAVKELARDSPMDFKRELLAIAKFSKYTEVFAHFYGWYETSDAVFFTMEYFRHGDLSMCLESPLQEHDAKVIARQLLVGISIMHGAGFAHRDLKPQIGDFSIAKRIHNDETAFRTRALTEAYSAPELYYFVDEDIETDKYDNAVDIWSLGCLIYKVLTETVPFPSLKILKRLSQAKSAFPAQALIACHVSAEGVNLLQRLLAPVPADRPTAVQALRALHKTWSEVDEGVVSVGASRMHASPSSSDENYQNLSTKGRSPDDDANQETQKTCVGFSGSMLGKTVNPNDTIQGNHHMLSPFNFEHTGEDLGSRRERNPQQSIPGTDSIKPKTITKPRAVDYEPTLDELRDTQNAKSWKSSMKNAIIEDNNQLVKMLLTEKYHPSAINVRDKDGRMFLHQAVDRRRESITMILLRNGANPRLRDSNGITALTLAVDRCLPDTVKNLLYYGADTEVWSLRGTPLWIAVDAVRTLTAPSLRSAQNAIIKTLLEYGANVNAPLPSRVYVNGPKILHYAAADLTPYLINLLIDEGAKLEGKCSKSPQGTPLVWAVSKSKDENVKTLLERGAQVPSGWKFLLRLKMSNLVPNTKKRIIDAKETQDLSRKMASTTDQPVKETT